MATIRGTQSIFYVENIPFLTKFDTNKARTIVCKTSGIHISIDIWCYSFSLDEQNTIATHTQKISFFQNGDNKESWSESWNLLIQRPLL